ncbi:MAG: DUF6527 family protein [Pseudomonas sp.]
MKVGSFRHEFMDYLPEELSEGTLYISLPHRTVAHLCACGCRREVVTPLAPTEWGLYFDGVNVSLHPSIGNWNFACRSHYFIRNSQVRWAADMSKAAVDGVRAQSQAQRKVYSGHKPISAREELGSEAHPAQQGATWLGPFRLGSLWERMRKLLAKK